MVIFYEKIDDFFDEILLNIKCESEIKSYVIGIYSKYKNSEFDLSNDSITLLLAQGQAKKDFLTYQKIGDWLFFAKSIFPKILQNASEDYYNSIAQLSYYNCYRIIRSWKIYEQLADEYVPLTKQINNALKIFNYKDHYAF